VEALLLLISTPFMAVLIAAEMIYSHFHQKELYSGKDTVINLLCSSLNFLNDLIFRVVTLAILTWAFSFRVFSFEDKGLIYWTLLFFAQDFAYYVLHYVDHYSRFFWATHVTHHSSEKFNFTVAIRSSVFQPYYRWLYFVPIALMGFEALDIIFMYAACQVYGFWVHTETIKKLPTWFEFIFVTPSHHRVHHASNVEYLDSNMGMVLIIWDRLFGTFRPEKELIKPVYGLTKNIGSFHPTDVVFHEWKAIGEDFKKAPDWKSKMSYVFGPPGWSHDGSRLTSKQLREKTQAKSPSYSNQL
jgi:sterol desaturase/sphingolipid hydroxylase (fatty acid hydroxylase superfamily)